MEQLHSMQTQLIERPLTDCGGRQWCVSFASRLGKHPICDFGGTTYEVDGLECESACTPLPPPRRHPWSMGASTSDHPPQELAGPIGSLTLEESQVQSIEASVNYE